MNLKAWGAIFDWDGVVLNSAPAHEESWRRLAKEVGQSMPEDHFKRGFGMKNETIIPTLFSWTQDREEIRRMSARKEELYREIIHNTGVELLPGVAEWLHQLQAHAIPCAVGSSTHELNIVTALQMLSLDGTFPVIVSSEDVSHGKPDPEVFLLAAERMKMLPESCVVFEDTPVGIEAARAAGMKAVAVTTTHPPQALKDADAIVQRLDELSIAQLRTWFA